MPIGGWGQRQVECTTCVKQRADARMSWLEKNEHDGFFGWMNPVLFDEAGNVKSRRYGGGTGCPLSAQGLARSF